MKMRTPLEMVRDAGILIAKDRGWNYAEPICIEMFGYVFCARCGNDVPIVGLANYPYGEDVFTTVISMEEFKRYLERASGMEVEMWVIGGRPIVEVMFKER